MQKFIKKQKDLIILATILLLVVVFMAIMTATFTYFSKNKSAEGEITLGELDYEIEVTNMPTKKLMPGDNVNINVTLKNEVENKQNLIPFYFRFKILDNGEDYSSKYVTLTSGNNFIEDNNFYYYKYKVQYGETVSLIKNIFVDTSLTQEEAKDINMQILVDAVQSEYMAYKEIFDDAPKEWIEFIENN